jgi:serine/threonine protein kinase
VSQQSIDPTDDLPVWEFEPGEEITPGNLAWEPLGVGQRCETWLAWSTGLWTPVVVKLARPHQADHPRARVAVSRECDALIACPHPGVPQLVEDGRAASPPFLVQEYIDGPTLDAALETGPLSAVETIALAAQLTAVVRFLHLQGFAHVDLKPDNVILRDGRPTLIDLGSARPLGRLQPAGKPIGSPGYASPELEAGEPISESMDLYGIATIVYEALTGEAAFDPDCPAQDRPAPQTLGLPTDVPDSLELLTRELLAVDPAQRPGNAEALLTRLQDCFAAARGGALWPESASQHLRAAAERSSDRARRGPVDQLAASS